MLVVGAGRRLSRGRRGRGPADHDRIRILGAGGNRKGAVREDEQPHDEIEDLEPARHDMEFEQRNGIERQFGARRLDDGAAARDRLQMIDGDRRAVFRARDAGGVEGKFHPFEPLFQIGGDALADPVDLDRTRLQAQDKRKERGADNQAAGQHEAARHQQDPSQQARLDGAEGDSPGIGSPAAHGDRFVG